MTESINENTEQNENLDWDMSDVQFTPVERTNGERAQRLLELSGVKEARQDDEVFDNKLQELDFNGAYKYLTAINGILRGVNKSERGVRNNVVVGDHIAPDRGIQKQNLEDTIDALKQVKNNHYRAALAYYTVNNLHLFADGNGRTSRAVYDIFNNPDFDLNGEGFTHETDDVNESYGHGNFESKEHIYPAFHAYNFARRAVVDDLTKTEGLDDRVDKLETSLGIIYTTTPDIYLTEDAEQNLTPAEKKAVNRAFHDGDFASVALARQLNAMGRLSDVIDESTKHLNGKEYICYEVEKFDIDNGQPNEAAANTFKGWTADDYRDFIKRFRGVQVMTQRKLNDFFINPDKHTFRDGLTVAEFLTNKK